MNCNNCEHYILGECIGLEGIKLDLSSCFLDNQYGLATNSTELKELENTYKKLGDIKDIIIADVINLDVHTNKTKSELYQVWNLRRNISITHILEICQLLNVNLRLDDIRGESFYAGIPRTTANDVRVAKNYLKE